MSAGTSDVTRLARDGSTGLQSGTHTFLFTDVEGSSRMWVADEVGMSSSMALHDEIVRQTIDARGGHIFTTAGDSFGAAFSDARLAVDAASAIQQTLATARWTGPAPKVRIGLHIGNAEERGGDFFGVAVNTAARVEDAGHGGQTLISEAVRVAADIDARDLGVHELRDVAEPIRLFQVGAGEFPQLRTIDRRPSNLPAQPMRLFGRADEVSRVHRLLQRSRLVTLTAIGGVGKTQLAIAVGHGEVGHRPDGVWFVDLTAIRSGAAVAPAVAEATGLTLSGGDPTEQVIGFLADKAALVVLDNCEHVLDEAAEFADRFLTAPGNSRILATSRAALEIAGEYVVPLEPLATAETNAPAVQVFVDRASAVNPGFQVINGDAEVVRKICVRLDGVPLAIELAAARSTVLTPDEILAGLNDRFGLLTSRRRRQRHRTLRETLDWSYTDLEDGDQAVFRASAAFVDGFDLRALTAVSGVSRPATIDAVESIASRSLAKRTSGAQRSRFSLLETVRAFAIDQLEVTGEADAVRNRHAEYFHALAAAEGAVAQGLLGIGSSLRQDVSNLTTAIEWSLTAGEATRAAEALIGSSMAYFMNQRVTEFRALLAATLSELGPNRDELSDHLRIHLLFASGMLSDGPEIERWSSELASSPGAAFRAIGWSARSIRESLTGGPLGPEHLRQVERELVAVDRPADSAANVGAVPEFAIRYAAFAGLYVALRAQRYAEALDHARHVLVPTAGGTDRWTFAQVAATTNAAACEILIGDPAAALQSVAWLDHYELPYHDGTEIRALANLALGDVPEALRFVKVHARRAATGRLPHESSDSVVLLAALAGHDGGDDEARRLLLDAGPARLPAMSAFAEHLADQLDAGAEYRARVDADRARGDDGRSMRALRSQIERRGWD